MDPGLEKLLESEKRPKFKSEGERRIAYFLDDNSIRYQYEPGILVNSLENKPRIWYPDFYLSEFGIYIEYFGLFGRQSYDSGIKRKDRVYSKMGLDVIPIYPWTFAENWQGYIMRKIEDISLRRYKNLMKKPYWSRNKIPAYNRSANPQPGYRQGPR